MDAKEFLALTIPTPVGHGWMLRANLDIITTTMGTSRFISPALFCEPFFCSFVIWETSSEALSMKVLADTIALDPFSVCTFVFIGSVSNSIYEIIAYLLQLFSEVLGYSPIIFTRVTFVG